MNAYDVIPYPGVPHVQTHPDRLATMAKLFGATPAPPAIETCRVLEIGCARGDNLIPLALSFPEAELVGVDLSRHQIEYGRDTAATMGARNVRLECLDLCDIDAGYGEFDFIVAHGVYSWVPEPVRDRLVAICRERLRPNGVAFVSYNVYPGWHRREPVRDALRYHTAAIDDPQRRIEQSIAMLEFLNRSIPEDLAAWAQEFRETHEQLERRPDRVPWLVHDILADVNQPVYFHEFAAHAARHGLQFLAEAEIAVMQTFQLPPQVETALAGLGEDIIRREQMLDFIRGRQFRQTLLCHETVVVDRAMKAERLQGLHVATDLKPVGDVSSIDPGSADPVVFRSPGGIELTTDDPLTRAGLLLLGRRWPESISFDELADEALREGGLPIEGGPPHRAELDAAVLQCYAAGALELRLVVPEFATRPGERPEASRWARRQADEGPRVTNLRHSRVRMNDFNCHLLCVLDGTRDRAQIVEALAERIERAGTTVKRGDALVEGGQALRSFIRETLEDELRAAARAALLVG